MGTPVAAADPNPTDPPREQTQIGGLGGSMAALPLTGEGQTTLLPTLVQGAAVTTKTTKYTYESNVDIKRRDTLDLYLPSVSDLLEEGGTSASNDML